VVRIVSLIEESSVVRVDSLTEDSSVVKIDSLAEGILSPTLPHPVPRLEGSEQHT